MSYRVWIWMNMCFKISMTRRYGVWIWVKDSKYFGFNIMIHITTDFSYTNSKVGKCALWHASKTKTHISVRIHSVSDQNLHCLESLTSHSFPSKDYLYSLLSKWSQVIFLICPWKHMLWVLISSAFWLKKVPFWASGYQVNIFLICQWKNMLGILIRNALARCFYWVAKT